MSSANDVFKLLILDENIKELMEIEMVHVNDEELSIAFRPDNPLLEVKKLVLYVKDPKSQTPRLFSGERSGVSRWAHS